MVILGAVWSKCNVPSPQRRVVSSGEVGCLALCCSI